MLETHVLAIRGPYRMATQVGHELSPRVQVNRPEWAVVRDVASAAVLLIVRVGDRRSRSDRRWSCFVGRQVGDQTIASARASVAAAPDAHAGTDGCWGVTKTRIAALWLRGGAGFMALNLRLTLA